MKPRQKKKPGTMDPTLLDAGNFNPLLNSGMTALREELMRRSLGHDPDYSILPKQILVEIPE